jgi:NAD(P)-dependent dehydrogenase (short-subunit alcohol dehydrogenase family)
MKSFEGKVAAVTGAGSGIGRELALEFARRGCHVAICCDRNMEGLQETADKARALGAEVTLERLDVSQRDAVYRWADKVVADHGKVNLLINNAGVELASTIEGVEIDDFKWLMDINFWGAVYGTKALSEGGRRRPYCERLQRVRPRGRAVTGCLQFSQICSSWIYRQPAGRTRYIGLWSQCHQCTPGWYKNADCPDRAHQ